jgi:hypothetical protein
MERNGEGAFKRGSLHINPISLIPPFSWNDAEKGRIGTAFAAPLWRRRRLPGAAHERAAGHTHAATRQETKAEQMIVENARLPASATGGAHQSATWHTVE